MSLMEQLDELLRAQDCMVSREIDAGACRTSYDFKRAREARDKFEELREAFETQLRKVSP